MVYHPLGYQGHKAMGHCVTIVTITWSVPMTSHSHLSLPPSQSNSNQSHDSSWTHARVFMHPDSYPWSQYTVLHSCGALWLHVFPPIMHNPYTELYSLLYLVLCPLWSYAPMPSPHNMFPSICFMFTFPITPWLFLILLWNMIQFILVFKLLVSTHVP